MSVQQINLLHGDLLPKTDPLTAQHLLSLWGAFVVVLIGLTSWFQWSVSSLEDEAVTSQQQLDVLVQANAASRRNQTDPAAMRDEIRSLENQLMQQQSFVAALTDRSGTGGFSARLKALAAARVNDVWLDRIQLAKGTLLPDQESGPGMTVPAPARIVLEGGAVDAAAVPRLLRKLSGQAEFQGEHFNLMTIQRQDDAPTLRFKVSDSSSEQSG